MPRLREEFDSDLIRRNQATNYRSTVNRDGIPCSVCGKTVFVNAEIKRDFERATGRDLDYTFTCYECEEEYDRLPSNKLSATFLS